MSVYACNPEGVKALNTMSGAIVKSVDEIKKSTKSVRSVADDNKSSLGPHVESLYKALEDIENTFKKATDPAGEVAEKLNGVAEAYQEVIDDDALAR